MGRELSPGAVARILSMLPITAGSLHAPDGVPKALETALLGRNPQLRIHAKAGAGGHDAALVVGGENFAERLRQAARRVKDTGVVGFIVPNARHLSALDGFLRGALAAGAEGMEREAIMQAAGKAGVPLGRLGSVIEDRPAAEAAVQALQPYLARLGLSANEAFERLAPSHFVGQTRPRTGRAEPIRVTGATLGSKPDAMAIVRMQAPLAALNTLPSFAVGPVTPKPQITEADRQRRKDIFVWQRPILQRGPSLPAYRAILGSHRLLVVEFDDHPMRWPAIAENDYLTFRAAHAVRTSTDVLADIIRQWNPSVFVSPNQIETLPPFRPVEDREGPVRLLFAALNRKDDWAPHIAAVNEAIRDLTPDRLRVDVIFDRDFFDAVEAQSKHFHPMQPLAGYTALLGQADVAWLPLEDNLFNRCKSDLKFIECAAHSVAVVASPVLYEKTVRQGETGLFYRSASELRANLSRLIDDRGLRASLTSAAHAEIVSKRLRVGHSAAEAAWYESLAADREMLEAARLERLTGIAPEWREVV